MASTDLTNMKEDQSRDGQETISEENKVIHDYNNLILSLPRENGCDTQYFYFYHGFWCPSTLIQSVNSFQNNFHAKDSDIVVASMPKSGTTWLKGLAYAIVNRQHFTSLENNHPLLSFNPHELVPHFEVSGNNTDGQMPQIDVPNMVEPRLYGTHMPFPSLPKSIQESNCKIIYICRNPFDTFVSYWTFINKLRLKKSLTELTLEESFERYCKGICFFGPFWDNMLGYLKESIERPDRVLFLKYEDLKEDVNFHTKRIAEFVGFPFTEEEENNGVIENIIKLCSFESMKESSENKSGTAALKIEREFFFRKGEIGDWVNYLSPSMIKKLSKVMEEKLSGSSLSFKGCP
ncbi:putative P-loop containing nucleoside triphosphate hydrolase [Medicago truncatula]|uniref:Sulfotransferase n=1 Tax=Medicago truncatula TaxID=3880 RepID=A0A396GGH9_MEDTR|nr:cytosolic sulfotransferase 15 [Medicago truncatula]XP_024628343.1 cytosolic sulfotransferase 15 [Medicago truncatula]RHN40339.1 putative P-loop containing nucleoside triphosphate hydrolase [Medicago truncatula]